jgi:hypothetical protein
VWIPWTIARGRGLLASRPVIRLVTTAYWLVLILWIVTLFSAASVAMNAFGTMKDLTISAPDTAGLPPDHSTGRYLAGFVADPAFRSYERWSLLLAPAMTALLFAQRRVLGWPTAGWMNRIRVASLVVAIALALVHLIGFAPGMARDLAAYREAVATGDAAVAAERYASFDAGHAWADRILRFQGFALVLAAVTSAWVLTPRRTPQRGLMAAPGFVGMR